MVKRPYTLKEAVAALVKSVAGGASRRKPAAGTTRYAVYTYDDERAKCLGKPSSLTSAFELLADDYWPEEAPGGMTLEDQLGVEETKYRLPTNLAWLKPQLARLRDTKYRALVYRMSGILEPMTVEVERPWEDPYLGRTLRKHPGGRFLFLCSAAAPHDEDAFAIIETPGAAAGTSAKAPLHAAVAAMNLPLVKRLIAAGADPNAGLEVGNAPIFAVANPKAGTTAPKLTAPKNAAHQEVLDWLLDHGADARATTGRGETLIDRALLAPTYPEKWIADLTRRKVTSKLLGKRNPLHHLVEEVSVQYWRPPKKLLHQLRFLLERGEDPNRPGGLRGDSPLHDFLKTGFKEGESDFSFIVAMFELFLRNGLTDHPNQDGARLSAIADGWVRHGFKHYGALADRLRRAR